MDLIDIIGTLYEKDFKKIENDIVKQESLKWDWKNLILYNDGA